MWNTPQMPTFDLTATYVLQRVKNDYANPSVSGTRGIFYALLLWLMILFPNICELLQVANIMDEWRTARLFPVLSPECDIKTRWRNFFLMWFYRVKEVAILHVNINSPEQSRINADSHFTVCLLSSSLPLTKTSNSGAHQKLQRQQLRGGQLLGVIEADWLGKCQMTNAARGLPDRGDNASPAQPQPWSADTSKKNTTYVSFCKTNKLELETAIPLWPKEISAVLRLHRHSARPSAVCSINGPKQPGDKTDDKAVHSVAFPIPISVTLETVVHTGKSNSTEAAGRAGEYNYKARLNVSRGWEEEKKERRWGRKKNQREMSAD